MPKFQTRRECVEARRCAVHTIVDEHRTALPGEWIVDYDGEEVVIFSDDVFRVQFEPVPGDDEALRVWEYGNRT